MRLLSIAIAASGLILTGCDRDAGDRRAIAEMMRPQAEGWLAAAEIAINRGEHRGEPRRIGHAWAGLGSDSFICGDLTTSTHQEVRPRFMWRSVGDNRLLVEDRPGWAAEEWSRQCGRPPAIILAPKVIVTKAMRYPAAARVQLEALQPAS